MESTGRTAAEHVTGTGMAQLAIDRHAASATRQAVTAPASSYCDAGYCRRRACLDLKRHVRVAGIPGEVRYLCCEHATGIKGHRANHPEVRG